MHGAGSELHGREMLGRHPEPYLGIIEHDPGAVRLPHEGKVVLAVKAHKALQQVDAPPLHPLVQLFQVHLLQSSAHLLSRICLLHGLSLACKGTMNHMPRHPEASAQSLGCTCSSASRLKFTAAGLGSKAEYSPASIPRHQLTHVSGKALLVSMLGAHL